MKRYKVTLCLTEDNRHSAYLINGLLELESLGELELVIRSLPIPFKNRFVLNQDKNQGKKSKLSYPWCPELVVKDLSSNIEVRVGIDLQDWPEMYAVHALEKCDIIYKRAMLQDESFHIEYYNALIKPFGPNHSEKISDPRVLESIRSSRLKSNFIKSLNNPRKAISSYLRLNKKVRTINKVESEYPTFPIPTFPYVFFQVECHTWKNNSRAEVINEFRAELIRGMRSALGNRFVGGMFFRGEINPKYADCLTNVDPNPVNYKNFVKNAAVVISTNGFGDSIPWKLLEYMKWGCCIVSEKNKHQFRKPVEEGVMECFTSVQEAIDKINDLLADERKRTSMSKGAMNYYKQYVYPPNSIRDLLVDATKLN